jgi:hypothetical protein
MLLSRELSTGNRLLATGNWGFTSQIGHQKRQSVAVFWRLRESSPRAGCGKSARPVRRAGCGNGSMVELVRYRQTKELATDRLHLNHRATPRLNKLRYI